MNIDHYKTCPGQTGKKIKFCCGKDVLPGFNQVLSLHHGKQHQAAAEKVARLIEQHGPKACLMGLQVHILIHLKQYSQAERVNQQFLASHPRNPLGYQHRALLSAARGDGIAAVDALQDGVDACGKGDLPLTMANAFRTVGMCLMSQGLVVAGRNHLFIASLMREGQDEVVSELIVQSYRSQDIPLLLKSEFRLPEMTPEETSAVPWGDRFKNACRFAEVGRWRAARTLANQLLDQFPDQPELVYAVAIWSLSLADIPTAIEMLERYSELETVDLDDAAEARAVAFVLSDDGLTEDCDIQLFSFPIDDPEKLVELAVGSPRFLNGSMLGRSLITADAPPPIHAFLILDSDEVRSINDHDGGDFPRIHAEILVYGKQTDRSARADIILIENNDSDQILQSIKDTLEGCLGDHEPIEVIDQISLLDNRLNVSWHLPPDMPEKQRLEFIHEQHAVEYLESFPEIPFKVLNGKTPNQAVGDPELRVSLAGLTLMMEQSSSAATIESFDYNRLREKLSVPLQAPLETTADGINHLSPIQCQRIDFRSADDDVVSRALLIATSTGNLRVVRDSGKEILNRPDLESFIPFEKVYSLLARMTFDTDHALELMQKARNHATAAERPVGGLLIDELELRLERNRTEGCDELLRILQARHLQDPQNRFRLGMVLQRFGLVDPDGQLRSEPAAGPEASADASAAGEIWQPGDPQPAASASESGQSKLWLPD